jgi:hypothetical protein
VTHGGVLLPPRRHDGVGGERGEGHLREAVEEEEEGMASTNGAGGGGRGDRRDGAKMEDAASGGGTCRIQQMGLVIGVTRLMDNISYRLCRLGRDQSHLLQQS